MVQELLAENPSTEDREKAEDKMCDNMSKVCEPLDTHNICYNDDIENQTHQSPYQYTVLYECKGASECWDSNN